MHIKWVHSGPLACLQLSKNSFGVFHLLPFSIHQILRSYDIVLKSVENILDEAVKIALNPFEFVDTLFVFVERTLSCSNNGEFIGNLRDRLKFLFLQLSQVAINSEISHVLSIFFNF